MDEAVDAEALQAQIDLSNSVAYDLVSSWMKPSSKNFTSSASSVTRELEEYAKRPPRLGLGAFVPKAAAATMREAANLKGRLVGKKRTRDGGIDGASTSMAGRVNEEDDDEESRSTAISAKKVKLNGIQNLTSRKDKGKGQAVEGSMRSDRRNEPIAPKDDPKKQHHMKSASLDVTNLGVPASPNKANPFVIPDTSLTASSFVKLASPSTSGIISSAESPHPRKKKKKRRERRLSKEEMEEEWHGFSIDPEHQIFDDTLSSHILPNDSEPPTTEQTEVGDSQRHKILNSPPGLDSETGDNEAQLTSERTKKKRRRRGKEKKSHQSNE